MNFNVSRNMHFGRFGKKKQIIYVEEMRVKMWIIFWVWFKLKSSFLISIWPLNESLLCLQGIKKRNPNTPSSHFKLRESFHFSINKQNHGFTCFFKKGKFYSKENNFRLKMFSKNLVISSTTWFAFYHLLVSCTRFEILSILKGIFYFLIYF